MEEMTIIIVACIISYTVIKIFKYCTDCERMRVLYEEYKKERDRK
jgi:hypothetical protein